MRGNNYFINDTSLELYAYAVKVLKEVHISRRDNKVIWECINGFSIIQIELTSDEILPTLTIIELLDFKEKIFELVGYAQMLDCNIIWEC